MKISEEYETRKREIDQRLLEFTKVWEEPDERVFAELCFCLCTPQSGAKRCWAAVSQLYDTESRALFTASAREVAAVLREHGVRFCNTKAERIVRAREHIPIKRMIDPTEPEAARQWLVENINGLGYKEASHFLRNIGLGQEFAILDRHILKNLVRLQVIPEMPKSMTDKRYLEIEQKMKRFAYDAGIPMGELDLLFWSMETGEVFK
jgi:N-glycosylase/DNA lyase